MNCLIFISGLSRYFILSFDNLEEMGQEFGSGLVRGAA
jgi:hypothetical protein